MRDLITTVFEVVALLCLVAALTVPAWHRFGAGAGLGVAGFGLLLASGFIEEAGKRRK